MELQPQLKKEMRQDQKLADIEKKPNQITSALNITPKQKKIWGMNRTDAKRLFFEIIGALLGLAIELAIEIQYW